MEYREDIPLRSQLRKWFGFEAFKGNQEAIIRNLLQGRDTFVLMPTGGGKSLCFQLPAIILPGTAIVVSPLIALMKNQVDLIRSYSELDGIAHFLNSSLNRKQVAAVRDDVTSGRTKLLYVAPESLTKERNIDFLRNVPISFYAIDEAHCISEWGHDFRPEYRRIRPLVNEIGVAPIIALTATATPKVQDDIQKNLGMQNATVFRSSFNRPNLFYEIRPKDNATREILRFIKDNPGKSGIIYCMSREKVDQMAEVLKVNGVKALPYHAGKDPATRSQNQDAFLNEDVDIIVATIAFGMGIDKPDVRFVIHYDIPKSLEGYYQETGRAGRDGGEGRCIAFFANKDLKRLEHFMQGKPMTEQEIGRQLIQDTKYYAQGGDCRRAMLLHYFGEHYDKIPCGCCDNCRTPQPRFEGQIPLSTVLRVVQKIGEGFRADHVVNILTGIEHSDVKLYKHDALPEYASGQEKGAFYWHSIVRQAILHGYLRKDIQCYGLLYLTEKGSVYLENPEPIDLVEDHDYDKEQRTEESISENEGMSSIDPTLLSMLKRLRKEEARKNDVPPFVIFQNSSLEDMTAQYPVTIEELQYMSGVSLGKAKRYGKPFVELIRAYVEENGITRPMDLVVKSLPNRSQLKISLIQSIDRKMDFEDIASSRGISVEDLLTDVESLVSSGIRLDVGYYVDQTVEPELQEQVYDYFRHEASSDSLDEAFNALADLDITEEELRLVRIRFLSEMGN